jgi:hypothetical protein
MAKAGTKEKPKKPSKKNQYERFQETARQLGVDDEYSAQKFERDFAKIVPPKSRPRTS